MEEIIGFIGLMTGIVSLVYVAYRTVTDKPSVWQSEQAIAYQQERQAREASIDGFWAGMNTFFSCLWTIVGTAILWLVIAAVVIWAWRIVF